MIADSGERRVFGSGAVRDIQEHKGRCDLLPLKEVSEFLDYSPLSEEQRCCPLYWVHRYIDSAINKPDGIGCRWYIYDAIYRFVEESGIGKYDLILEVSKHFEEGARKYKRNNWRLGINASCYIDSGVRHYLKWKMGMRDEPHDRAFVWNMLCLLWTVDNRPDYNDVRKIEDVEPS